MKTMQDYIVYCTPEQTKRAKKMGAPIEIRNQAHYLFDTPAVQIGETKGEYGQPVGVYYSCPTTQQMRGWLMDKELYIEIALNGECSYKLSVYISTEEDGELDIDIEASDSYKDLELAAIDAALDYLEKGETK